MVFQQLPFFACLNQFIDPILQTDISKYIYCQESGIQPYSGSYGEQPAIWIEKYFIIKRTISEMERVAIKQQTPKRK
tara:strand:+ start:285 stop:515 length:231 start_codon:yes stop_codon:yes gene_type:complete